MDRTQPPFCVFSTGSTPMLPSNSMKIIRIKTEENNSETNFSFDCNIAKGA
jgi:hypothetical protein